MTLCIVGAYTRAANIPDLMQAQGCLNTLRDLDEDLCRGLINIPLDIVEAALQQGADSYSYETLRHTPAVEGWLHKELAHGARCVVRAGRTLATNQDRRAVMVLRPLGGVGPPHRLGVQLSLPDGWAMEVTRMAPSDTPVATLSYRDGHLLWYACGLQQVAERFGTPCYVGCAEAVDAALQAFRAPFLTVGLPVEIRFSVKTHPVPVFLETLRRAGTGFEVVSTQELDLLRQLGVPGDRIVVTGLRQGLATAQRAQAGGIQMVTVTTLGQFRTLLAGVENLTPPLPIALSVCPELWRGHWDLTVNTGAKGAAVGFRPGSAELEMVLNDIVLHKQFELVGLHMHIGSGIRSAAPYIQGLKVLAGVIRHTAKRGQAIRVLNIGGGFGLSRAPVLGAWRVVASLFGSPNASSVGDHQHTLLQEVAEAVARTFVHLERDTICPEVLLTEPGRILSGPCQLLLLTITDVVHRGRRRRFLLCNGGAMTLSPMLLTERHRVMAVRDLGSSQQRYCVLGNLPSALDRVSAGAVLPTLRPGDHLAVLDTGAYFVSMTNTFGGPRPPIVWIENGRAQLARRRETDAELFRRDLLPASLYGNQGQGQ